MRTPGALPHRCHHRRSSRNHPRGIPRHSRPIPKRRRHPPPAIPRRPAARAPQRRIRCRPRRPRTRLHGRAGCARPAATGWREARKPMAPTRSARTASRRAEATARSRMARSRSGSRAGSATAQSRREAGSRTPPRQQRQRSAERPRKRRASWFRSWASDPFPSCPLQEQAFLPLPAIPGETRPYSGLDERPTRAPSADAPTAPARTAVCSPPGRRARRASRR